LVYSIFIIRNYNCIDYNFLIADSPVESAMDCGSPTAVGVDGNVVSPSDDSVSSPPEQPPPKTPRPRRSVAVVGVAGSSSAGVSGIANPVGDQPGAASTPTVGVRARVRPMKLEARASTVKVPDSEVASEIAALRRDLTILQAERDRIVAEYSATNIEYLKVKADLTVEKNRLMVAREYFFLSFFFFLF
jgi:hypothetical protein